MISVNSEDKITALEINIKNLYYLQEPFVNNSNIIYYAIKSKTNSKSITDK